MNIVRRMPRNRGAPRFRWMFELAMTAFRRHQIPSIVSKEFEDITNFHGAQMIGYPCGNRKPYNDHELSGTPERVARKV